MLKGPTEAYHRHWVRQVSRYWPCRLVSPGCSVRARACGGITRRFVQLSRYSLTVLSLLLITLGTAGAGPGEEELVQRMQSGGHALLIRHAYAPGTGDPARFRLGDCSTQRNLSEEGRLQAKEIGEWLRARGVGRARVYSSQWCRCLETARLLGLGEVTELPPLNSFFERPADREPNLAALRDFLAAQPRDGELLVLVTHQVTISALSGEYAASGHGVLMALGDGGALRPAELVDFGQ